MDDGSEDWIYTAHFPAHKVPSDIADPIKKKIMEKAGDKQALHKARQHLDLWAPKSQDKQNIRLVRIIKDNNHMDEEECEDVNGRDDDSSDSS